MICDVIKPVGVDGPAPGCFDVGKVIKAAEVDRQQIPGTGDFGFLSNHIASTKNVFADLVFAPGDGLNFHTHPQQEEFVYLVSGTLEVWIEKNNVTMNVDDTPFVPAGMVHAAFNVSDSPATIVVV